MKVRNGFVSNSSSSSYIIKDVNHEGIKKLLDYQKNGEMYDCYTYDIGIKNKTAEDIVDNAISWIASEYLKIDIDEFLE